MNSADIRRYQIALDRGFKGGFKEFCQQRAKDMKYKETSRRRRRPEQLEEYVAAIVKGSEGVV